jgi:hypothetical protein
VRVETITIFGFDFAIYLWSDAGVPGGEAIRIAGLPELFQVILAPTGIERARNATQAEKWYPLC